MQKKCYWNITKWFDKLVIIGIQMKFHLSRRRLSGDPI